MSKTFFAAWLKMVHMKTDQEIPVRGHEVRICNLFLWVFTHLPLEIRSTGHTSRRLPNLISENYSTKSSTRGFKSLISALCSCSFLSRTTRWMWQARFTRLTKLRRKLWIVKYYILDKKLYPDSVLSLRLKCNGLLHFHKKWIVTWVLNEMTHYAHTTWRVSQCGSYLHRAYKIFSDDIHWQENE